MSAKDSILSLSILSTNRKMNLFSIPEKGILKTKASPEKQKKEVAKQS